MGFGLSYDHNDSRPRHGWSALFKISKAFKKIAHDSAKPILDQKLSKNIFISYPPKYKVYKSTWNKLKEWIINYIKSQGVRQTSAKRIYILASGSELYTLRQKRQNERIKIIQRENLLWIFEGFLFLNLRL